MARDGRNRLFPLIRKILNRLLPHSSGKLEPLFDRRHSRFQHLQAAYELRERLVEPRRDGAFLGLLHRRLGGLDVAPAPRQPMPSSPRALDAQQLAEQEKIAAVAARAAEAEQRLAAEKARDEARQQEERATLEADAAVAARGLAENERVRAEAALAEAEQQRTRADQRARLAMVSEQILDEMLQQLDPSKNAGQDWTIRQFFDSAVRDLDARQDLWPLAAEVKERLQRVMAAL